MPQEFAEPRTSEEMFRTLVEAGRTRLFADTLTAARQKRLTRADFAVIERRALAALDEARAAAEEFPFDVDDAVDRAKHILREYCRACSPPEWR